MQGEGRLGLWVGKRVNTNLPSVRPRLSWKEMVYHLSSPSTGYRQPTAVLCVDEDMGWCAHRCTASPGLQDPEYLPAPPQCWQLGRQVVKSGRGAGAHMLGEEERTNSPDSVGRGNAIPAFPHLAFTCQSGNHLPFPFLLLQSHLCILPASVWHLKKRVSLSIPMKTGSSR